MIRLTVASGLAVLLAASPQAAKPSVYDGIVGFGTSLSDSGNAAALLNEVSTPPDYGVDELLVPSAPYAKGGQHLTNGATWIEQFARPLGLEGSVKPAFRSSSRGATNFAVGGARANNTGLFSLPVQVGAFLSETGGEAPSGALYAIEMGSNDVRDALVAALQGQNPAPIVSGAAQSIATSIQTLYAAGARQFLVWNTPDIALTPAVRTLAAVNPAIGVLATQFSAGFNSALLAKLTPLSALPGIQITQLDVFLLLHQIVASPSSFGLSNATDACITPNQPPFACRNPDEFLFWDGIHPTRAGHAVIAQDAAIVLAP